MSSTAPLDNVAHAALRLRRGHGAQFGEAVNQVAIVASEFDRVQREYPILFVREAGRLQPVAILGLARDENLFLDGERWDADYVPALFRRGPFQLGAAEDGEAELHVDLDHPRIAAADEEGDPVFKPHGGNAPALDAAAAALRDLSAGAAVAATMDALFEDCALVEPARLRVQIDAHAEVEFGGHLAITPEAVARLDGEALARLNRAGLLDVAIFAAASLGTMPRLIARKRRQLAGTG